MKKITFLFLLFIAFCGYTQEPIMINAPKRIPLLEDDISMKRITYIDEGDTLYLLGYKENKFSFYVLHNGIKGFIFNWHLSDIPNLNEIQETLKDDEIPKVERTSIPRPGVRTRTTLQRYRDMYGTPDDTQNFESGDYKSITYIWYCSRGKYRSVTFVFKYEKGEYVKESEYTSDCIQ